MGTAIQLVRDDGVAARAQPAICDIRSSVSLPAGIRLESRIEVGHSAVIGDENQLHQVAM